MFVIVNFTPLTGPLLFVIVALSHVMHGQVVDGLVVNLFVNSFPNCFNTLFIIQALENSITSNHEEVEVGLKFEYSDFGVAHDNVRVASVPDSLCLDVAKGTRDRQTSREHSEGALHVEILFTWLCCSFCKCLSSVNFSSSRLNSNFFLFIVGLVIARHDSDL